jgi:Tfp pilus assembly PilM family ATPase
VKVNKGLERSPENDSIFNLISSFLENLAVEIEKTTDFFLGMPENSKDKIDTIILSGGGANLKGLIPYLSVRLSKKIILGNPWVNLNFGDKLPIINKNDSARYATAIGLAMRKNIYGCKA